jgi:hypothetical protein
VGDGIDLKVFGIFEKGEEVVLGRSSRTTYEAYPAGIVSVSKEGQVIAKVPGTATIVVHHQSLRAAVSVSVPDASLKITSPAEGTVVHPGETLAVDVNPSGGPYKEISVFSLDLGVLDTLKTPPYQFALQIPMPKNPGPARLGAFGRVGSLTISSDPVSVDVERLDAPEAISVERRVIGTERLSIGEQGQIIVYGRFHDNSQVNLRESSLVTYEADKKGIVEITKDGFTKGLAPGSTKVTVRYGELRTTVNILVE